MSYALFLDDDPNRIPGKLSWIELPLREWVFVRTYDEFVKTINERGIPDTCSYDHDLFREHYDEYAIAHNPNSPTFGRIRYEIFKEKTGMECARFLANLCVERQIPIPPYFVHTLNPIGRENIRLIMEGARKVLKRALTTEQTDATLNS